MSNEQKNPLALRLPQYVRHEIRNWVARNGKAMPGHVVAVSGAIVTVNFDVTDLVLPPVTMPVLGAEYIRLPIQAKSDDYAGDKGGCLPFDFYMGGVSGLGSAPTADSSPQGNLANLVWVPIGNKNWTVPPGADGSTLALYGHLTTLLLDSISGNSSIKLASTGVTIAFGSGSITLSSTGVTIAFGSHSVVIDTSGVTIDGILWDTHEHTAGTYVAGTTPVTLKSGGPTGP